MSTPTPTTYYMNEPWFALLKARYALTLTKKDVAKQLGISPTTLSMVINGTGNYGDGAASTDRIAERVIHIYGRYPCPHLSEQAGEERVITAIQCHSYATSAPPTTSPRAIQHWQACRTCPHLNHLPATPLNTPSTTPKGA